MVYMYMAVDMQHCDMVGCAVGVIIVSMLGTSIYVDRQQQKMKVK